LFDDGALYDRLLGDFDYGLTFYGDLARQAGGPVLDIACGTGRILLPCLEAGIDIEGLDLYEGMLAQLREKALAKGLSPRLHQADMSDFQTGRQYALIMIPFNAVIHNLTTDDQIRCLTRCREHLLPGGLLAFDTFFPAAEVVNVPPATRVLEGETRDPQTGLRIRAYDTRTFDRVAQTQHSLMDIEFVNGDGELVRVERFEFTTRWMYKNEMELLLRLAGFTRWEICGDFDRRPMERETDLQIVLAFV
jgi:SAM-dependent methyltransferase